MPVTDTAVLAFLQARTHTGRTVSSQRVGLTNNSCAVRKSFCTAFFFGPVMLICCKTGHFFKSVLEELIVELAFSQVTECVW